jgi:hypothetical protein
MASLMKFVSGDEAHIKSTAAFLLVGRLYARHRFLHHSLNPYRDPTFDDIPNSLYLLND